MTNVGELLGTGDIAELTGYSPSGIKKLERLGVIPRALRVAGTGRRAWRSEDLPLIQERIEERRAANLTGPSVPRPVSDSIVIDCT